MTGWSRSGWTRAVRGLIQRAILFPILRLLCRPLRIEGRDRLPAGPVLLVANHASHADTAVLLRALPRRIRARTAPAAAEDYFFGDRVRGAAVSLLVGAFPFPRHGPAGIERARVVLHSGWSVLLFPQGSRRGGPFRPGAAILAMGGVTVVPIGIDGTAAILPRGRRIPRPGPVRVRFGDAVRYPAGSDPLEVTGDLERRVLALAGQPPAPASVPAMASVGSTS